MSTLTNQPINPTYEYLLQRGRFALDEPLQDGYGVLVPVLYTTASKAITASYVNITGSGVLVNYAPDGVIQLTGSAAVATASVIVSSTAPITDVTGALWYDDVSGSLFVYYNDGTGSYWVQANNGWSASYSTTASYVESASYALTASYVLSSSYALTASYIDVTGSGVLINWNGPTLQLTGSVAAEGFVYTSSITPQAVTGSLLFSASAAQPAALILANYQALNFANNAAAAAAGIPLGGVYRSGNFLLIRTT